LKARILKPIALGLAAALLVLMFGTQLPGQLPALASDNSSSNSTVNLEVEVVLPQPSPPSRGGSGGASYSIETDVFGTSGSFNTDYKGEMWRDFDATSEDGLLSIHIEKGTVALGADGKRLDTLEVVIVDDPPAPPEDSSIVGLPYDFGPDGATFDPPMALTWQYDPDDLPEGVSEETLTLAYYDVGTGEWVELECVVDTETNTVTASISHFTVFALVGRVAVAPPVAPGPVAPVPPVAPPIPAPSPPVVVEPVPEPGEPEPVAPAPTPPPPLPLAPEPSTGTLIYLVVVVSLLVCGGVIVWVLLRRRREAARFQ